MCVCVCVCVCVIVTVIHHLWDMFIFEVSVHIFDGVISDLTYLLMLACLKFSGFLFFLARLLRIVIRLVLHYFPFTVSAPYCFLLHDGVSVVDIYQESPWFI